jgi:uncharacterized Tic20 family protein
MEDISAPVFYSPDQDERTMATLAHALQVVGWFIAPLVIFLIKPESRFVRFHALQALLLQAVHVVLYFILAVAWIAVIFSSVFRQAATSSQQPPFPLAFFIAFPFIWLAMMGLWVFIVVVAILYAVKAGRGEWAQYPLVGRWARRILSI